MKQTDHETSRELDAAEQEIIENAMQYPDIVRQALARSSGLIGEILVARQLEGMGCKVSIHNNNLEQHDLSVFLNGLEVAHVEVKTGRDKRPTWFVRTKPQPSQAIPKIWVFVAAPRGKLIPNLAEVEMFVLTAKEAREIWTCSKWNIANPRNGDIRRHQMPENSKGAWGKIAPELLSGFAPSDAKI